MVETIMATKEEKERERQALEIRQSIF